MKTILIIEDNEYIRENVAEILMLSDYNVVVAENGLVGVEMMNIHSPDLILCDIMMPGLDGYGVLKEMKNLPELDGRPFIFMTSKSEKSDVAVAASLGANDYIIKPFDAHELMNLIEVRLGK